MHSDPNYNSARPRTGGDVDIRKKVLRSRRKSLVVINLRLVDISTRYRDIKSPDEPSASRKVSFRLTMFGNHPCFFLVGWRRGCIINKPYSLNAEEWKSTLLGVILGISSFWSGNPLSQNSGIHSKVVVWITLLRVDSTILSVDFHSKRSDL